MVAGTWSVEITDFFCPVVMMLLACSVMEDGARMSSLKVEFFFLFLAFHAWYT